MKIREGFGEVRNLRKCAMDKLDNVGALKGQRVLDLTRLLPGGFCSLMLADMGADVIKIEEPGRGDYSRDIEPLAQTMSGSFLLLNRNKRSIELNLKSPEGREIFMHLAGAADVVIEGFRPGVMDRLGLSYATLRADNPRLIYCAITSYGQTGPYRDRPGHDLNTLAITGALNLFSRPDVGPMVPGLSIADIGGGGQMALTGILATLIFRSASGHGQFVDVSMTDGLVSWLTMHGADYLFAGIEPRGGERPFLGQAACYNVYRCADGEYVALGIVETHFWQRFCQAVGLKELASRQWCGADEARLQRQRVQEIFDTRTRQQWLELLEPIDIPLAPVNSFTEAFRDPHFLSRDLLLEIDHPLEGRIPQLGFPLKFSDTPCSIRREPPTRGQHTDEVLKEAGYSADQISGFRAAGAI
jgi:crotonobetainyl-CoA:carnitine CoA-transferase CaiB-like acyl-CoA transferase